MKLFYLLLACLLSIQIGFSQEYDSVYFDKNNTDTNNNVYKIGNAYIFDYEIIDEGKKYKLLSNSGMFASRKFELVPIMTDTIVLQKIHMIVIPENDANKSNQHQTKISYIVGPPYNTISSTGVVDNEQNIWIHPIREGFFSALETAPFPYVKKPLTIGQEWQDKLRIGQGWRDKKWGEWEGALILSYNYKTASKIILNTEIGDIECFKTVSTANSSIGITKLTSYYSEVYGFVRLEYELLNNLFINIWLIDYKTNKQFNSTFEFMKTKEYIKQ